MADPFQEVGPGDRVFPIQAVAWNAMLGAGRAWKRRNEFGPGDAGAIVPRAGNRIRVKNESGASVDRFGILALRDPIFLPSDSEDAFKREVTFRTATPATSDKGKFVIADAPLDVDRIGWAYIVGVCPCKINMLATGDTSADITVGDASMLTSGGTGAEILWVEDGTGVKNAIVRIGTPGGGVLPAFTTSAISGRVGATPGTGTVALDTWDGTSLGTGATVTVRNKFTTGPAASKGCWVAYFSGAYWLVDWEC